LGVFRLDASFTEGEVDHYLVTFADRAYLDVRRTWITPKSSHPELRLAGVLVEQEKRAI
jgi:hypothetical protein